jgi:GNAT superfamily N-acetyltransferase
MPIDVVPAAVAGWPAVDAVFQREATSRDCNCQFHVLTNAQWRDTTRESRRELLHEQIETLDPPRGLIALDAGEPVGWAGVEPRTRVKHILASKLVTTSGHQPLDDPSVWSIYCILVPAPNRRRGIASALLGAAIDHATASGATVIEGLPIDAAQRGSKSLAGFSTGTLTMFEREGFRAVAALPSGRTLVRRES